jgi:mevalonate kinase
MTTGNKTSSISTSASAPGKLILFGEHAVVHGEPAIAACLTDLRIKVDVCTRKDGVISINLPDLKPEPLSIEIPSLSLLKIDQLEISASSSPSSSVSEGKEKCFKSLLGERGPPTSDNTKAIHEILAKVASYKSKSENKNKKNSNNSNQNETEESVSPLSELHISALTPLIYLINILLSSLSFNDGLSIIVKSQNLPLGAGLGSSAAFSVAASAALYKLFLLLEDDNGDNDGNDDDDDGDEKKCSTDGISIGAGAGTDNNNQRPAKKMKTEFQDTRNKLEQVGQPTKEQLDTINMLAFYSETLIHGTPSGIDNTVSTYGGALQYTKTKHAIKEGKKETRAESETIFLHNFPQLNVILTNTNVPRSTRILVQGVKTLKEDYPEIVDPILDSIGQIARYALNVILQRI